MHHRLHERFLNGVGGVGVAGRVQRLRERPGMGRVQRLELGGRVARDDELAGVVVPRHGPKHACHLALHTGMPPEVWVAQWKLRGVG